VILGILSDTHGRHERTARAIRLLQGLGAEAFVHCGDVGGERVFDELTGLRAWFVWGNTDLAGAKLRAYVRTLGLPVPENVPLRLEMEGRRIAVFHGHEPQFTRLARLLRAERFAEFEQAVHTLVRESRLAPGGQVSVAAEESNAGGVRHSRTTGCYLLCGHSHRAADVRVGRVHLINPGALNHTRLPTVATLDLARDVVKFWHVDDHADRGQPPRQPHPRP
jgi:predicted phosphodiesterase